MLTSHMRLRSRPAFGGNVLLKLRAGRTPWDPQDVDKRQQPAKQRLLLCTVWDGRSGARFWRREETARANALGNRRYGIGIFHHGRDVLVHQSAHAGGDSECAARCRESRACSERQAWPEFETNEVTACPWPNIGGYQGRLGRSTCSPTWC